MDYFRFLKKQQEEKKLKKEKKLKNEKNINFYYFD